MRKIILAGIFGAIILFVWNAFSWMVLPWHVRTVNQFIDEGSVSKVIKSNISGPGIYLSQFSNPTLDDSPIIFASVDGDRRTGMESQLLVYFLIELVAALLVSYLTAYIRSPNYFGRLGFILIFALAASVACHLPYWDWWHFPINFILGTISDMIIGWFLAGIIIAALVGPRNHHRTPTNQITIHRE